MRDVEITISFKDLENYLKSIGEKGIRIEHNNETLKGYGSFVQKPEVLAKDMWEQITKSKIDLEKTEFEINKKYNYKLFKKAYSSVGNLLKYSKECKIRSFFDYDNGGYITPPYHPYVAFDKFSPYTIDKLYKEGIMPRAIDVYNKAKRIIANEKEETKDIQAQNTVKGIVYLLKVEDEEQYKIGVTKNLSKRLDQISPKMPFELEVKHKIKSDDIYGLENKLHDKFDDKRIKGEWFELDKKDVNYIKSL